MDARTLSLAIALVALGLGAGIVIGFWCTRHREAAELTCGCGHSVALHELRTRLGDPEDTCHAEVRRPNYDHRGHQVGWWFKRCRCRHYTGISPFEEDE